MSDSDRSKKNLQDEVLPDGNQRGEELLQTDNFYRAEQDRFRVDKQALRKAVDRSASSYTGHAQVFDEIANRLMERLELLNISPARILDLGTGDGRHLPLLRQRYPDAIVFGADISELCLRGATQKKRFWHRTPPLVCMDADQLWPFADESFDLVISNILLPWINETDQFAAELERVLAKGGAFFVSSAGPDTLIELRRAWAQVDAHTHVNAFLDMHDVGDMLARAGLADPVMDTERIEILYKDVESLLIELVATGCHCAVAGRRRGLMGKSVRHSVAANYQRTRSAGSSTDANIAGVPNATVSATMELVVAHGWKQLTSGAGRRDSDNPGERIIQFHHKPWQSQLRK